MSKILSLLLVCVFISSCSSVESLMGDYYPQAVKDDDQNFTLTWAKNLDPVYNSGNLPIAFNSPLINEGLVFAGHANGEMVAYQLDNGRPVWSEKDKGGHHGRPILYKDMIIYGTNQGRVIARNFLTGKIVYSVDVGSSIESQGVLYKGRVFFHLRNHQIFSLDATTGKTLWAYKRSVPYLTTLQRVSRPVIAENRLYVGFADGNVGAFSIEDGVLLWEKKISNGSKFIDIDSSPIYFDGKILSASLTGQISLLNARTGNLLKKVEISASRAPLVLGDRFIVGTSDGYLVELDSRLNEMRRVNISEGSITSMISWKGHIVAASVVGELVLVNPKDFSVIESKHLGSKLSAVFGELDSKENKLALISSRNRLYVFK